MYNTQIVNFALNSLFFHAQNTFSILSLDDIFSLHLSYIQFINIGNLNVCHNIFFSFSFCFLVTLVSLPILDFIKESALCIVSYLNSCNRI